MEDLAVFISNQGFPIVIAILMFQNNSKFVQAIQDLTVTLKGLDTRIEMIEKERKE